MGVHTYIAKRKPQTFRTDSGEELKVYPLAYVNRRSDEDFEWYGDYASNRYCGSPKLYYEKDHLKDEKRLAARHRMAARAWENDFHEKEIPLVTIVQPYYWDIEGKWNPVYDCLVYKFTDGDTSQILESEGSVYKDVPCFWYDCGGIGEPVGRFVCREGEWIVKPVDGSTKGTT